MRRGPGKIGALRRTVFALLITAIHLACSQAMAAELRWKSGGKLPGRLDSAVAERVHWTSPLLEGQLSLQMAFLESIQFPEPDGIDPPGPLRFRMRTGDVFYGQLREITATGDVRITSRRHGSMTFPLQELRSFRRFDDPAMAYFGPTGTTGWKTLRVDRFTSDWQRNEQGEISTNVYGAELFRDLRLGDIAELDISLRWGRRPGFLISFVNPRDLRLSQDAVRLEIKDNKIVLQTLAADGRPQVIMPLSGRSRSASFRLIWNQPAGELAVYSPRGRLLGKLKTTREGSRGHTGLLIRNRGSDLTIADLRVNDERGRSAVRLHDGTAYYGEIRQLDPASGELTLAAEDDSTRSIPIDRVAVGYLGDGGPEEGAAPQVQLNYYDGTLLRGRLESLEGGRLRLQTSYCREPLPADLAGAQEILFLQPMPSPPYLGTLEFRDGKLQGRLAPTGSQKSPLGWQPLGSDSAHAIPTSQSARYVQDLMQRARAGGARPPRDVIYLVNGDVLRCRVAAIDARAIIASTLLSGETQVPLASVKAIDFSSTPQRSPEPRGPQRIEKAAKQAFLTLPRQRRDNPPTHALAAKNGDWLRGKLLEVASDRVRFALPTEQIEIPRGRVASIVWLDNEPAALPAEQTDPTPVVRAECMDGSQLTFVPLDLSKDRLRFRHSTLGERELPLLLVREMDIWPRNHRSPFDAYSEWQLIDAKDPQFLTAAGKSDSADRGVGQRSPLVGKPAPSVALTSLDGRPLRLGEYQGRVVVLQFWATWSAPCLVTLPETAATVATFPRERVAYLAVNQEQEAAAVRRFLERRGFNFAVGLDPHGEVAEGFEVRALPQHVILDGDGIIQRVFVGDMRDLQEHLRASLDQLTAAEPAQKSQ